MHVYARIHTYTLYWDIGGRGTLLPIGSLQTPLQSRSASGSPCILRALGMVPKCGQLPGAAELRQLFDTLHVDLKPSIEPSTMCICPRILNILKHVQFFFPCFTHGSSVSWVTVCL